jgi:hypothetical protein
VATTPDDKDPKKPDASQEAFVREVDDAVRQDVASNFLSRYGKATVGVVIAGLLGYAGWLWYSNNQAETAGALGGELMTALDSADANNAAAANSGAAKLARSGNPAYRGAALLLQGNVALAKGDTKAATTAFAKLANDGSAPEDLRQLATIRQTLAELDSLKPDVVITRMQPLLARDGKAEDATWGATALELTAIAKMQQGKTAEAQALYSKIANRKDAPPSLKSRASQMASMLSGAESPAAPTTAPTTAVPATANTAKQAGQNPATLTKETSK